MSPAARMWRAWWPAARAWTLVWGGAVVVYVLADGFGWDDGTRSLLYLAASGALGGYLLHVGRRAIVIVGGGLLLGAAVASVGLSWLQARSFTGSPERIERTGVTMRGPVQRFEGVVGGRRTWLASGTGGDADLAFEARALRSGGANPWQGIGGAEVEVSDASAFDAAAPGATRVVAPSDGSAAVRHFVVTDAPLAGRTFRVRVDARGLDPASADVPVLTVSDQHGAYRRAVPMPLDAAWHTYEVAWTVPDDVPWTGLAIIIDGLGGMELELAEVRVDERVDGEWRGPIEGLPLAARLAGTETSVDIGPYWTPQRVPGGGVGPGRVEARLTVGSGHAVEVRDVRIVASEPGQRVRPLADNNRVSFAGTHPNLIAQSVVVVFLVSLVLARSLPVRVLLTLVALAGLWPLGSRAALLGAGVGALVLALGRFRSRARWLTVAAVTTCVALALAISLGPSFSRPSSQAVPARWDIWGAAVGAYLEHPGNGVGPNFGAYWEATNAGVTPVAHAHNLWLHFAAGHGTPGLLAVTWLTVGLLTLAWRWGRWRGTALVAAVLVMNVVDVTLFFAGVLYPLTLGLNALRTVSGTSARP